MRRSFPIPTLVLAAVLLSTTGSASGEWRRAGLEGRIINAVAVDPSNSSILYAGAQIGGLWKSTDAGQTWSPINNGYTGDLASFFFVDPAAHLTLYVGSNTGVFQSVNGGANWAPRNDGLPAGGIVAMAVDPANSSRLFVSVNAPGGGVFRSADAGFNWTSRPLPVPSGTVATLTVFGSNVYAGWANVVFRSSDDGVTWSIPYADILPSSVQTIAVRPGETEAVVGLGQRGIWRSTLTPGPIWIDSSIGLTSFRISKIVVRPGDPNTLFAASNAGGVFRSSDSGHTWSPLMGGLGNTDVASLAFDASGRFLYAGTSDGVYALDLETVGCGDTAALCLNHSRFRVRVEWRVESQGTSGVANPVPLAEDSGSFWFFSPNNLELLVKVVDGRAFNGHYWVFYGALSDVAYTITVTDTTTGQVRTYVNAAGTVASRADVAAF
jgi:photosystem II stability/assembly factor-like uncharacterized protein